MLILKIMSKISFALTTFYKCPSNQRCRIMQNHATVVFIPTFYTPCTDNLFSLLTTVGHKIIRILVDTFSRPIMCVI